MEALKQVIDPELFVNVVDLGLVYGADVDDVGNVKVTMTLTSPAVPSAPWSAKWCRMPLGRWKT
jgi:metal-sulfur cluster biosynthetic enzyme